MEALPSRVAWLKWFHWLTLSRALIATNTYLGGTWYKYPKLSVEKLLFGKSLEGILVVANYIKLIILFHNKKCF